MSAPGTVNVSPQGGSVYAVITAPESDVTLGAMDFYGSVLGKSLTLTGNVNIHNDISTIAGIYYVAKADSYSEVTPP